MTDHAHELRRYAQKLDGAPCTGDTRTVMRLAAAHIEDLERRLREAEKDANRLEWVMNNATRDDLSRYPHHVLRRAGNGDMSDIRTFIDDEIQPARGGDSNAG